MKRIIQLVVAILLCLSLVSCSSAQHDLLPLPLSGLAQEEPGADPEQGETGAGQDAEQEKVIRVFCHSAEVIDLMKRFKELHPDFGYEIEIYNEYMFGDEYRYPGDRVHNLLNGVFDVEPPDIYSVPMDEIYRFAKGRDHQFALPYEELGLDVEELVKKAEIPQYMIDAGTNPDGKLVALGYDNTAGAFIYRRSIARKVWGTDDPAIIAGKIGPEWDNFLNAAAELKKKGYAICSGVYDLWQPFEMSAEQGWGPADDPVIDPKREAFLDYAREMIEKGYTNHTVSWTDEWYADMAGKGEKPVFGFFGPYWFVYYLLMNHSGGETVGEGTYGDWAVCDPPAGFYFGGTAILVNKQTKHREAVGELIRWLTLDTTENGCQYLWATGAFSKIGSSPASGAVSRNVECKLDFLGGQDLFEAYRSAARYVNTNGLSEFDSDIGELFLQEAIEYAEGRKSRDQAISDFKQRAKDWYAWYKEVFIDKKDKSEETGLNGSASNAKKEKVIRIYDAFGGLSELVDKFLELHPDFDYGIEFQELNYHPDPHRFLQDILQGKSDVEPPDIYMVDMYHAIAYTQGSASQYALPYEELGLDVDKLTKEAGIPRYVIDVGTNPEGKLVGLGYNSAAGAFVYRRSIARKVWGTDDPAVIRERIGPGWDKFFRAASDLAAKGYAVCSDISDLWTPVAMNSLQGWVRDGKLVIDPRREAFLDYARKLVENNYTNRVQWWTAEWYEQVAGKGDRPIFGYLAPYWFISYVLMPYSESEADGQGLYGDWAVCDPPVDFFYGGTMILANKNTRYKDGVAEFIRWLTLDTSRTGCQYLIASGELLKGLELPVSYTVMESMSRKVDFLGGQDVFKAYLSAGKNAKGAGLSEYDEAIDNLWLTEVTAYAEGRKTREQALADFKRQVASQLGLRVE